MKKNSRKKILQKLLKKAQPAEQLEQDENLQPEQPKVEVAPVQGYGEAYFKAAVNIIAMQTAQEIMNEIERKFGA